MKTPHATRRAPGEYEMLGHKISHIEMPDEGSGYGRTDHWIVVDPDGYCWDPFDTLGAAKDGIREVVGC